MNGTITLILIVGGWLVYYGSSCWIWPYTKCLKCKGARIYRAWWGGDAFRPCPRCGGSGSRLRFGRWIYNRLRKVGKDGSR